MSANKADLAQIRTFLQLVKYLRDELDWPIASDDFEDLTFDYSAEELGIDRKNAAKIQEIKRLRPLSVYQPWGVFFVKFEPKKLPVVALKRILNSVVLKKRASANHSERAAWDAEDLLFISNYGEGEARQITFAHFSQDPAKGHLPTLKVLGWDNLDTPLHIDHVAEELSEHLAWPTDETDVDGWRETWGSAFTLRHREVITTSKQLAIRLAELARSIRDRIRTALAVETEAGPFTKLMKAFQEALVHDLDAEGFADMYAQTIAYGLLSARIANPTGSSPDDFAAHMPVTNPFLKELMETFLHTGERKTKTGGPELDFDELGLNEVVGLLDHANMEAVILDFGDRNPQEDPVIHFYELFLAEYDRKQKVRRGVFYTPRPVVSYIVRSVDEVLREEFGLHDGLADTTTWGELEGRHEGLTIPEGISRDQDFVQILDPATGTGTFLVEVIDLIHRTLVMKWREQGHGDKSVETLWNEYVPSHLLPRIHGYELLMAPYAIAHLKIGLKLYETGYRFGSEERVQVYLTNALEPASDLASQFEFAIPALAHEARAVNDVKRSVRFPVVVGNPPYSGLSANMSESAASLIEPYKYIADTHFGERKHWLHDDYVKFFRLMETTVLASGAGVLGLITNHAFYDNPTFRGMRWTLMQSFPRMKLLDLHGNTMKREKNPTVFKDKNVFDIQQGVAISIVSRPSAPLGEERLFGELWGSRDDKYSALTRQSSAELCPKALLPVDPFFFFVPRSDQGADEYMSWTGLQQVFPVFAGGFITARDEFVIDFDQTALLSRIETLRDDVLSDEAIREELFKGRGSPKYPDGDSRGWKLPEARRRLREDGEWRERTAQCLYRPFDFRWIYWAKWMVDWPRPEVNGHLLREGNLGLVFMRQVASGDDYSQFLVSRVPVDARACYSNKGIMSLAPLFLHPAQDPDNRLDLDDGRTPNLAASFLGDLAGATGCQVDELRRDPEQVLQYIYGVVHSQAYRSRYSEMLRSDFPRIPLPGSEVLFRALVHAGSELVRIHLMESATLKNFVSSYNGPKVPEVGRVLWSNGTVWLDAAKKGTRVVPGTAGFDGVPETVWNFHVGGYQVCEKWLKDRKGRTLSEGDIEHYQRIVVALSETIRIMGEIDEVIEEHGDWPGAFRG
ncbi:MAG: type ISP restriction/modification enzyme [Actinomycetota bacterium]